MTETRTRVRKPDPETASEENIVANEERVTVAETKDENGVTRAALTVPSSLVEEGEAAAVNPTPLSGPFVRDGFHIVDSTGRKIAMAGVEGDIVRTGPGIAQAFLDYLNREFVEAGRV